MYKTYLKLALASQTCYIAVLETWPSSAAPDPGVLFADVAQLDAVFGVENDGLVGAADHL